MLARLLEGHALDEEQARGLMRRVMAGEVGPVPLAAALAALRVRGETVDEITGFARAMREAAVRVEADPDGLIDTCGTGGDASGTFNISTATALTAAAMGIPVAKHGNRAVSSRSGSADVLEALGVAVVTQPEHAARLIREVGIGFLFAPALHPAMKHAMPVRRELGVRTVFNVLGPLTNPAGARRQLLGVYDAALCEPLARVLGRLGSEHAFVVHGAGGLDEISPCGETLVAELLGGEVRTWTVTPEEAGVTRCRLEDLAGGAPDDNAAIIRGVLEGRGGPATEAVVLNAGFAAVAAGRAKDPAAGVALARSALAEGRGAALLANLAEASQRLVKEDA
jgi:anthranilate phosphoribosyltransferase